MSGQRERTLTGKSQRPFAQQTLLDRHRHPTGIWEEFPRQALAGSIVDRFEQQVERHPHRLAVKIGAQQLTYTQLNTQANRLAHAILQSQGEQAEPVALLLEHGLQIIIAFLAVLKSGKFYVPIDSEYPEQRTRQIFNVTGSTLIVTNTEHLNTARRLRQEQTTMINMDDLNEQLPAATPELVILPDAFAYVTYTSGSTGQPKGVIIDHRNVLHFTMSLTNQCHICPQDHIGFTNSFSYNGVALSFYTALLNGAAYFPIYVQEVGARAVARWLHEEKITFIFMLPSLFRQIVNTLPEGATFSHLRLLGMGGDSVSRADLHLFQQHFPPTCLYRNGLGTSEVKVIAQYCMDHDTQLDDDKAPVGYPFDDTEIFLLNDNGDPVPANQIGEIAVKSRYMSRGYWRNPSLTNAKFLPDPNGGAERIYLTGDLGLIRDDGCLYHLGRKDFQVKIRGHRVELVEIEAALLAHEAVAEAVVVAHTEQETEATLVAYIVVKNAALPSVTALRHYLQERLPAHMIPIAYHLLEALPRTAVGKVDRQALPAPNRARPALAVAYTLPHTSLEEDLVQIWQEILSLDQIGIHDPFFELGGDSLQAMRIVTRLQAMFNVEITPADLFAAATVAEMTLVLAQQMTNQLTAAEITDLLASDEEPTENATRS